MSRRRKERAKEYRPRMQSVTADQLQLGDKDYTKTCCVCGEKPTVFCYVNDPAPLCGPCTFGEAETYGGNW